MSFAFDSAEAEAALLARTQELEAAEREVARLRGNVKWLRGVVRVGLWTHGFDADCQAPVAYTAEEFERMSASALVGATP